MLLIWANFFGRSRMVVVFFFMLIILSLPAVIGVLSLPLPAAIIWFLISLWIFAVIFVLPAAIYMIDRDRLANPRRPRTLGNLFRALSGK